MEDGKPTGPKAKWWSRPGAARATPTEPEGPPSEPPQARMPGPVEEPVPADAVRSPQTAYPEHSTGAGPVPAEGAGPGAAHHGPVPAEGPPSPASGPRPPVPVSEPVPVATGGGTRQQPLHEPDEYSTPPYGGPGPWAPAPPVQRPVPTPAQGTPVPTPAQGTPVPTPAQGTSVPPPPYPAAPGTAPAPGQPASAPGTGATDGGGFALPPPHQPAPSPGAPQAPHQPQNTSPYPGYPPHPQGHQPQGAGAPGEAPASHWRQYDPWGTPGSAPLTYSGEPARRKSRRGALLAGAVLLALVSGGIGGGIGSYIERNGGINEVELDQAPRESGGRAPDSVAGIAASALPSVVTLHVSGGGEQGTGTGFVLDKQGHILTNNHVVDPAGSAGDISVTFSGGEIAKATLVGKDSGYDLAVVKVTGVSGLTPLPLGNSDNVRVGDPVVAIGAPFDLQNTVTSGIISAKERPITAGGEKGDGSDVSYVDALQTDAPINPGNSGGPLVDTKARVIGINSAIRAADTGGGAEGGQSGSIGLGFAIPINQGKRVAEELINTGKATHPVIGVSLDMKYTGDGARVGDKGTDGSPSVTPGGPSAKAGVKPGDVITKVDDQRVHSGEELIVKIRSHRPGDRLELTVLRGGQERRITLTLGSADGG
ncbi:trypsin-like peptidase domain-containing protein [Streptomyces sp. NPDC051018]|uniref:trypsin-like peptidase domain-containing protein n=1 Tax=Streptomyces sp. NPDC051018 TaxID=3365639 RepID=UPI0037BADB4E